MTTGDAAGLGTTPAPFAGLRAKLRRRRPRPQPAPLAFAREKRLLLGALALLVALPFPLNEPRPDGVVSWPVLILYLGADRRFPGACPAREPSSACRPGR